MQSNRFSPDSLRVHDFPYWQ